MSAKATGWKCLEAQLSRSLGDSAVKSDTDIVTFCLFI